MAETWISVTEAASLSGYHPEHLRELIREGKVKARKFVTVWQIDRLSLQAYIRAAEKSGDKRRGAKKRS
jgi:excisionase family DNA binding protein